MTDRRERPARLAGVEGEAASIAPFAAFMLQSPGGGRDRQALHGDAVTVLERAGGWAFVEAAKDGYCGYLPETALAPPVDATHAVCVRQSHLYPFAGMKHPPLLRLPFGAGLRIEGPEGRWARTATGLVHRTHIRKIDAVGDDPVAVAEMFLGTPYLWAGNTGDGIDCSGLVQAAHLACGIACPGDSDQQAERLGDQIPPDAPVRRGDLFFWTGHVALARDAETLIHATAYRMAVIHESLSEAVDRIAAQGDGPVTCRRRLPGPAAA